MPIKTCFFALAQVYKVQILMEELASFGSKDGNNNTKNSMFVCIRFPIAIELS